jgi:hypothetical protein
MVMQMWTVQQFYVVMPHSLVVGGYKSFRGTYQLPLHLPPQRLNQNVPTKRNICPPIYI